MRKIQNLIFYTILFATTGILVISLSYNTKVSDLFSLMAAVGFILMPVGFSLAMFLSFQPVLVKPCQKVRVYGWDDHDFRVLAYGYLGYFGLFISIPYLLKRLSIKSEWLSSWNKHTYEEILADFWELLLPIIGIVIIPFLLVLLSGRLTRLVKRRHSIRPFHCLNCQSFLKKLDSQNISSYLNSQEKTASQIGSTNFEGWHCTNCYSILERSGINLQGKRT